MNCPKCGVCLGVSSTPDGSPRYLCVKCGWESQSVNDLVKASPAYRLADLKAQGAEPGWYGPDGQKCGDGYQRPDMVWWRHTLFTQQEARLCGFVEVPHD